MFSQRTNWDLSPNALQVVLDRVRALSHPVIDLTESNPTRVDLNYPETQILAAFNDLRALRYSPQPFGLPEARLAVSDYYKSQGVEVEASQIVLTASSSEAYSFLLALLCDPGTSIAVPRPSYPLFDSLAQLACVRLESYPIFYDGAWGLDTQALEAAIDHRLRAIFLVTPNNPTGSIVSCAELADLEALAKKHDLALVSDEVFSDYILTDRPGRVRCLAAEASVLSFSLGGLSKAACLPQMKLGWIVVGGPKSQRDDALGRLEMIADTFLSVGSPVQCAAKQLLTLRSSIRDEMLARISRNLKRLLELRPADSPVTVLDIEAGWYAILRVPRICSDEQWACLLVDQEQVLVHPGSFFGFADDGFLVVGLISKPCDFDEGISRVYRRIQKACA